MKQSLFLVLLILSTAAFAKKDPSTDARKDFANRYQQAIEKEGWPEAVMISGKSKEILQIWMPNASVDAMDRFEKQCIEPYKAGFKSQGFQTVEIKTDALSASYPKGVWDISLD